MWSPSDGSRYGMAGASHRTKPTSVGGSGVSRCGLQVRFRCGYPHVCLLASAARGCEAPVTVSRARRRYVGVAAVVAAAVSLSACGTSGTPSTTTAAPVSAPRPGAGKPPVTLGTKNFTEELILGQLYVQALRARGFAVVLKSNIGSSEVVDRELVSRRIDGYPEYTGTILSVLAHDSRRPASAGQAYTRAASFERGRGSELLGMASAQDTDVLITKPAYAS